MNKLSLAKLLLISTMLFTAIGYADEKFRYSELPKIQHPETACINAPLKENCVGKGASYYPWTSNAYALWKTTQHPLPDLFKKILEVVTKDVWSDDFRQELMKHDPVIWPVQGKGQHMDYAITLSDFPIKNDYGAYYWVRSFEGVSTSDTVYLVAFYHGCDLIKSSSDACIMLPNQAELINDEVINITEEELRDADQEMASHMARLYNLRAYRYENDQLIDVTEKVLPPLSSLALSSKDFKYYAQRGFSGLRLNLSRLDRVPVFRLESDIDYFYNDETKKHRYQDGKIHFGYMVWNGKSFEVTQWIHRDLWPCDEELITKDEKVTCRHQDDYFFVYDDNTVLEIQSDDGYTNLRSQPSVQGKVLAKLPNKTQLVITESLGDWLKVETLYEGTKGFVHYSQVERTEK